LIIFYIVLIFLLTIVFKRFYPSNKELLRKIIHIGIAPLIPFAKYLDVNQVSAQYFAAFVSLLILANYIYQLFPIIEDIDRKSFGTFFYCISLFILITIFWEKDPLSLIVGYFIMAFGDGLAGLIGKNLKSKQWIIFNQKKSLLGTITMLGTSLAVISLLGFISNYNFSVYYIYIAFQATLLEQISPIGIDNLTVPVISSLMFNVLITNA